MIRLRTRWLLGRLCVDGNCRIHHYWMICALRTVVLLLVTAFLFYFEVEIYLVPIVNIAFRMQFLRKMAQPYDKTGAMGKKTLLSEADLENMGNGNLMEMLF